MERQERQNYRAGVAKMEFFGAEEFSRENNSTEGYKILKQNKKDK